MITISTEIIKMNERHKQDYEKIEAMIGNSDYDFDDLTGDTESPEDDFNSQLNEARRLFTVIS